MEAIFVSKPYRYARKFLLSSKVILYTSVSKPYRYARKARDQRQEIRGKRCFKTL